MTLLFFANAHHTVAHGVCTHLVWHTVKLVAYFLTSHPCAGFHLCVRSDPSGILHEGARHDRTLPCR